MPLRWPEVDDLLRDRGRPEQLGGCARLALALLFVVLLGVGLLVQAAVRAW